MTIDLPRRGQSPSAPGGRPSGHRRAIVVIDGLAVDAVTEDEVIAQVRTGWTAQRGGWIVTVNVDILRAIRRDPRLLDLISGATVVADGMPLLWAARLAGTVLPERVTGSSLIISLTGAAAADGRSVAIVGGAPGVPERAARSLRDRFPALQVAGTFAPPFGFDRDRSEVLRTVDAVAATSPDLVHVGFGFPRQERFIRRLREALPQAWFIGCGGAIPMAAGEVRRATPLVQRLGLEWMHRLVLEPRRLGPRYLRHDLPFALGLMARSVGSRIG